MGQLECSFQRNDGQHQSQPHKIKGNNAQGLFSKPIFDLEANDCGIGAGFGKLNQGINWRITKEKGLLEAKPLRMQTTGKNACVEQEKATLMLEEDSHYEGWC